MTPPLSDHWKLSVPSSSGLLDSEKRVLNQTSIHPTGREARECRCCTCLSVNLSSFRVYLKPLMEMRVFCGNLELGISAPSLQALVSTAFLQVFSGIRLLLLAVQCHKTGQVQQWTTLWTAPKCVVSFLLAGCTVSSWIKYSPAANGTVMKSEKIMPSYKPCKWYNNNRKYCDLYDRSDTHTKISHVFNKSEAKIWRKIFLYLSWKLMSLMQRNMVGN